MAVPLDPCARAISRRSLLQGTAGLGMMLAAGCAPSHRARSTLDAAMPAAAVPDAAVPNWPAIDAHCHVFNAEDIPIRSFVNGVFLEPPFREIAAPLVLLVSFILEARAPDADQERAALSAMRARGVLMRAEGTEGRPSDLDRLTGALRRFIETPQPTTTHPMVRELRRMEPSAPVASREELLRRLQEETGVVQPLTQRRRGVLRADPDQARTLARGILASDGMLSNGIKWVLLFTHFRYEILDRLFELYGRETGGIRFVTPALVDFEYWIDPGQPVRTGLRDQVELMDLIARTLPARGLAMHGYVAFNPARQIVDEERRADGTALDLVKDAVRTRGFAGIKLYPPMGFRAWGNAGLADAEFPRLAERHRGFGARLDRVLDALYGWCAEEQVPILAHCNNSNSPRDEWGIRASPEHWAAVLERYGDLRLNLGHFGGLWRLPEERGAQASADWPDRIAGLMRRHPNVYADVGDFSSVLRRDGRDEARLQRIFGFLEKNRDVCGTRVLFGTDWSMLGRLPGHGAYLVRWREEVDRRLSGFWHDFTSGNAARFLGLAPPTGVSGASGGRPDTASRLRRYYAAHGLNPAVLERFAAPVG